MGRPRRIPAKESVIAAASLCVVAALPGCSAAAPSAAPSGLTVTGRGTRENGRYAGTLSYVIRDSYGFPVGDTLDGFGPPMRYLQTVCGAPRHAGGAHWFPDTITVTVPFSRPA